MLSLLSFSSSQPAARMTYLLSFSFHCWNGDVTCWLVIITPTSAHIHIFLRIYIFCLWFDNSFRGNVYPKVTFLAKYALSNSITLVSTIQLLWQNNYFSRVLEKFSAPEEEMNHDHNNAIIKIVLWTLFVYIFHS